MARRLRRLKMSINNNIKYHKTRPYLGIYNIGIYEADELAICCGIFINAVEFSEFIYGNNVNSDLIQYIRVRLYQMLKTKRMHKKYPPTFMKISGQIYEIDFIRVKSIFKKRPLTLNSELNGRYKTGILRNEKEINEYLH